MPSRFLPALLLAPLFCSAQAPNLAPILNFEGDQPLALPVGWGVNPKDAVHLDNQIVHSGKFAARIERSADAGGSLSGISKSIPLNFSGQRLEMRAFLRTEDVTGFVGLWAREDGETPTLAFDNMQGRNLKGTNDWAEYSISIPIRPEAGTLIFGVFVTGTGKVWADDLLLLVDGKPIWDAPKREMPKTVIDDDHEFDASSGVTLAALTPQQIDNLALLGKVWGFLKYHHPLVTGGKRHWDYDLFRALPKVLAATDRKAATAAVFQWIASLGIPDPCKTCAELSASDLYLRPDIDWINDQATLGFDLSTALRAIHADRPRQGQQFYVTLTPGVGNPQFRHELPYANMKPGDAGMRLLALYRFWNIVEYWYPNRDIVGENWDDVLRQSIPKIALAKTPDEYKREMMALIAQVHDTHANLWSSLDVRPPVGACQLPVTVRFVENRAVVSDSPAEATGLQRGDIIADLDGVPVSKLVEQWAPYYADSNDSTRLRDIARSLTRGGCGEVPLRILRGAESLPVNAKRVPAAPPQGPSTHDLDGATFRRSGDVAYLKLSSIKIAEVKGFIDKAAGTKGLIIDIRNYPSEFVVFALGQLLVDKETPFVRFTTGDLSNPGAFHWGSALSLQPGQPHYAGKVIILVDEVSQSQAEYTTMAFRTAPGAKVVGSTTAGADGNVSQIMLPGNLSSMISGIGVYYPDKKPTQRVGILPDIVATPTIAGIRDGRDEVLEEALRQILGPDTPAEQLRQFAK